MTVVASVIARERLTRVMLGGVLLACGGMSLVVLGKGSAFMLDAKSWVGIILVFAAGIIAGFTPIINKEALAHYSASKVTTWTIVFGAFFFLPLGVSDSSVTVVPQLPAWVWFAIVFTSLGATAFANIFWNYGIAHIGVVRMTIYGYLPPIIGILLSTVIMHESLTLIQWGGTLLTLGGVVVSQFDKIKFRRPRPVRAPQQIERVREYVEMVSTGKHQAVGKIAAH
jgi:drug/metabolite transporter (DMT)-like permease